MSECCGERVGGGFISPDWQRKSHGLFVAFIFATLLSRGCICYHPAPWISAIIFFRAEASEAFFRGNFFWSEYSVSSIWTFLLFLNGLCWRNWVAKQVFKENLSNFSLTRIFNNLIIVTSEKIQKQWQSAPCLAYILSVTDYNLSARLFHT